MHLNHVINFFFYCLIGPKFRNEVRQLFPKFCFKEAAIRPVLTSKSRNIITYPSTTFKKTPTSLTNNKNNKTSNEEFLIKTSDFLQFFYSLSSKCENHEKSSKVNDEPILFKLNRHSSI